MAFPESKSVAWKVVEEILGITFSAAATGTPSSSTYLRGDGAWTDPSGALQPLDADLTAIAALGFVSAGLLKKTAANTWTLDTTDYAPVASPTFTGAPAAPTATVTDDSTQIATTAHVKDFVTIGTWTPSLSNTTNVAASTAYLSTYLSVGGGGDGSVVLGFGRVDIDVTAATTDTVLGISLPVASAFANNGELAGVAVQDLAANPKGVGFIRADTTNDRALLSFNTAGAANYAYYFLFGYRVIV